MLIDDDFNVEEVLYWLSLNIILNEHGISSHTNGYIVIIN